MKWLFIGILAGLLSFGASAQTWTTKPIKGTLDMSSYDRPTNVFGGMTFISGLQAYNPFVTNLVLEVGQGGASMVDSWNANGEKRTLPIYAYGDNSGSTNMSFWMVSDNGGFTTTNPVITNGIHIQQMPGTYFNGTDYTNEGFGGIKVFHDFIGSPPHDTPGGDGGSFARDQGSTNLDILFGAPILNMWPALYNNGLWTQPSDFEPGSHPRPWSSTALGLIALRTNGVPQAIGSLSLDANTGVWTTNNWIVTSPSVSSTSISANIMPLSYPAAWDIGDSNIFDSRLMFTECPALGSIFTWTFQFQNLSSGMWDLFIDGHLMWSATAAQFAAGMNAFTNYTTPLWNVRYSGLVWTRIQMGVDPVTLQLAHTAGETGYISGVGDQINLESNENQQYDTNGKRGSAYTNAIISFMNNMMIYSQSNRLVIAPTNHTLLLTKESYSPAPFR